MADSAAADGKVEKAANGGGGCDATGEGKKRADQAVAFHELFAFADRWDLVLMAAGSLGALAHGAAMPLFFLLFGELINGFGKNQTDLRTMTDEVSKYALYFVYLGLVVCVSSYSEIACWMYTGERQVIALRKAYLDAVLRQDVGFFDTDARTGDIVFGVSTDTLLVQDAIGQKVAFRTGDFNHQVIFIGGLTDGLLATDELGDDCSISFNGCQDIVHYMRTNFACSKAVSGVILQFPDFSITSDSFKTFKEILNLPVG